MAVQLRTTNMKALLFLMVLFILSASPLKADTITESFMGAAAPGWVLGGSAMLTADILDPSGQGWLRLTPRAGVHQFGYAYYDTKYGQVLKVL